MCIVLNSLLSGEGLRILDFIVRLKKHTTSVNCREIIIYADNKHMMKDCYNEVNEDSDSAKEAGRIVEAIRNEVKSIKCEVTLEYSNAKAYSRKDFSQQPSPALIKCCDKKSKEGQMKLQYGKLCQNIESKAKVVPLVEGKIRKKNINVLTQELDAKRHKE